MSTALNSELAVRANHRCELCGGEADLSAYEVSGAPAEAESAEVVVCGVCAEQLAEGGTLDPKHWFCLQETIWSELAPVQVLSHRLLGRLKAEAWAADLLEQAWLDEERLAWSSAGQVEEAVNDNPVHDCNGVLLAAGDSVTLTKDLDPKGASFTAKRGTLVRKIRLTDVEGHILGKVNGVELYIKGIFLKKA